MEPSDVERIMNAIQDLRNDLTQRIEHNSMLILQNSDRLSELTARVDILEGKAELSDEEVKNDVKNSVSKRKNSRKTVFQQELDSVGEERDVTQRMVVVNMPPPKYDHIFLDSTNLADFATFLINWLEWERTYGMKLEPPRIIATRVRRLLQFNQEISDEEFAKLTASDFMKIMAKETKTSGKRDFALMMKSALENVRKLNWEKVTPVTHQKFFQAILRRKEIYLKVFRILMENNAQDCPPLKGKEFGLVQIFLDTVSDSYNDSIKAELKDINSTTYPKIEDFLTAYVDKAKEHYDLACGMRRFPYSGVDYNRNEKKSSNPGFAILILKYCSIFEAVNLLIVTSSCSNIVIFFKSSVLVNAVHIQFLLIYGVFISNIV